MTHLPQATVSVLVIRWFFYYLHWWPRYTCHFHIQSWIYIYIFIYIYILHEDWNTFKFMALTIIMTQFYRAVWLRVCWPCQSQSGGGMVVSPSKTNKLNSIICTAIELIGGELPSSQLMYTMHTVCKGKHHAFHHLFQPLPAIQITCFQFFFKLRTARFKNSFFPPDCSPYSMHHIYILFNLDLR